MLFFKEAQLEQSIIELLQNEGYEYVAGDEIKRAKDDVLLRDDMRAYLKKRYASDGITDMEVENAIRKIEQKTGGSIYEENITTLDLITNGFSLKREDATKQNLYIYPVSFDKNKDKNIFKVVNQFEIEGQTKRRPDAIVFVNGLPLVVFEFKSAVQKDTTIENAYKQLTIRYRQDIPLLFKYNAFIVISDGANNKFGTLFTPYEFFYAWRKINAKDKAQDGINSLLTMIPGLFAKNRLVDVIHNFIFVPDATRGETKFICRYPQYFAANALYQNILNHCKLNADGDGKGGIYFGATGCGKSMTMLFLARLLMRSKALCSPTIVFITDRTDLDDQLARQILNAKRFVGDEMVVQVESRDHLRELLQDRSSGGVFITTIHKFSKDIKLLSNRANIICISDEAHRSQTKLDEKIVITDEGVRRSYTFAKYLHDSLPNATYVGFTGTPIDDNIKVFGDIIDEYTMIEAVNDGITKRIVYEGRASKVIIDSDQVRLIEEYYNKCAEEGSTDYQIEESKKAMTQMSEILRNPDLIHRLTVDFIQHYERRVEEGSSVKGKAMIVCASRKIAFAIFKEIVKLRPEWNEVKICSDGESLTKEETEKIIPIQKVKLICNSDADDEKEFLETIGTEEYRKGLDLQFKEEKSNFKIAIVVDMWITGFDVPCLDTMYCYKPLKMHTLIQTISRVNRNYPGKDKGLVVDYLGIKKNMNAAMKRYANGGQNETPAEVVANALKLFRDELDLIRRMFVGFDYSAFSNGTPLEQLQCLNTAVELIQATEETEKNYMKHTGIMKSAFNMCCNDDSITDEEIADVHFFMAVRSVIFKITRGEAPDATSMNKHVMKMVDDALASEEVVEIQNMALDNAEEIDLLASQYMAKIQALPYKNTKVKLMQKLLKQVIDHVKQVNKIKAVDFSKRLNEIVDRYNDRSDDLVFADQVVTEVATQLAQLLEDIKEDAVLPEGIPNIEVKAFYDILKAVAEKYKFADNFTEEQFKGMAIEIKDIVDDKTKYIDWSKRDDIKAEMKVAIILTLAKQKYPPFTKDEVFKEIMEQAENFKKNRPLTKRILKSVDEDENVAHFVRSYVAMKKRVTLLKLVAECQKEFGERYPYMNMKDWMAITRDYAKEHTMHYVINNEEMVGMMAAEPEFGE